jgi:hypothetical protein
VDGGEVGDEGEESLEDLELSVNSLRGAVVDYLDGGRDVRLRGRLRARR